MSIRAREDNVIYANFGKKTRVSTPPPERRRIHSESLQQALIRDVYRTSTDEGRISRGRAYARNGNVVAFNVMRDRIVASVAGSQNEPFDVGIIFPRRGSEDLLKVSKTLLSSPGLLAQAREGRLTPDVVHALLADAPSDIRVLCDCPDRTLCCKHGVAVLDTLAEKVAATPGLLFELRGLNFAQLELTMQEEARAQSEKRAGDDASPESFWEGYPLPMLPTPKVAPALDDSDMDALHKAMRAVSYTSADELRAVSDIEDLYDFLTKLQ
ncbi:hypothetical protein HW450_12075 [Corynebacterium hindlerae]|uniref:SWIM-type domain-containing protein n=1 Tax=Corynebacterium hindlerae TaxID=699041 RepID=A0A7G5FEL0_9CORY|nr:hypothetical protein [Corynebacterium hindlerae]QMV85051.1 hypothetical protein HW450_12075 [Corynebacterium hindlerae]